MTDKPSISLWDSSALERDVRASILGDITVDVAVVGGGFTGLSTALHCAEKGLTTHVIESEQIGHGGSGRNCGFVNAALWLPPQDVREKLGKVYGPRFIERFGKGPEVVYGLVERHQMQCEAARVGTIHAAHSPAGFKDISDRHKEWMRLGEPVELMNREQVSEMIGTTSFYGGLVDHRAGMINPMGYCRGLARAAIGAGATISTNTTATKLRKDGAFWKVETTHGTVTANSVVLGTNAYTDKLWPQLNKAFTTINYFQFATKPLGPEASHIFPEKQGLWATGQVMLNLRRDAYDRLIIGSMGSVIGNKDTGLSKRWALKQLARIFPTLGPVEFEEAWHGKIAITSDHLPRIYELDSGLFTCIGYNGRGITTGTLFGQTMSDILTGMNRADLPLPITELTTVPSAPIMSRVYQAAFSANQILKSI